MACDCRSNDRDDRRSEDNPASVAGTGPNRLRFQGSELCENSTAPVCRRRPHFNSIHTSTEESGPNQDGGRETAGGSKGRWPEAAIGGMDGKPGRACHKMSQDRRPEIATALGLGWTGRRGMAGVARLRARAWMITAGNGVRRRVSAVEGRVRGMGKGWTCRGDSGMGRG